MKILFISAARGADYQCDMLFHGLRTTPGMVVTDVQPLRYMYKSGAEQAQKQRGFGFTVYSLLEDDPHVRRDNVAERIRQREFDFVIFGSIQRCADYLGDVLEHYAPSEVAFIDGEDHPVVLHALFGHGLYFKRELATYEGTSQRFRDWVRPISFAIPEEKIQADVSDKTRTMAFIDPRDTRTYIYTNETDHYADYGQSLFGVTMKKAGWDCLRHYEIMANNCIPYFVDLAMCPPETMVTLPKRLLLEINELILQRGLLYFETSEGVEVWRDYNSKVQAALRKHLTTKALAAYVLDCCASSRDVAPARHKSDRILTQVMMKLAERFSPSGEHEGRRRILNKLYLRLRPDDRK